MATLCISHTDRPRQASDKHKMSPAPSPPGERDREMGNRVQSLDQVEKGVPGKIPTRSGSRDDLLEMSFSLQIKSQGWGVAQSVGEHLHRIPQ